MKNKPDFKKTPKIGVLLSTYNGEKYLAQQIDSIINQENVQIKLYIRDDGSTDSTPQILDHYQKKYSDQIHVDFGKNIGWKKSYFQLLNSVEKFDYYAFSDQDDVWLPQKLFRAIQFLQKLSDPVSLYTGNVWITDEKLNIQRSFCPVKVNMLNRPIEEIMIQSCLPGGLTFVFTDMALQLVRRLYPGGICGHDSWVFRVCLYLGEVVYDDKPMVYYRQHGTNAIGSEKGISWWIQKKFSSVLGKKYPQQSKVAHKFLQIFGDDLKRNQNAYKLLYVISEYPKNLASKLRLIFYPNVKRRKKSETILLYIKILMGRF